MNSQKRNWTSFENQFVSRVSVTAGWQLDIFLNCTLFSLFCKLCEVLVYVVRSVHN